MTETEYTKVPQNETNTKSIKAEQTEYGYGVRHVQSFLFFLCLSLGYIARAHLGVTIVAMTNLPTKENSTVIFFNNTTENTSNIIISKDTKNNDIYENIKFNVNNTTLLNELGNENITDREVNLNNEDNISSIWNVYRTYDWPKSTQEMVLGSFFLGYLIMMFPMGLVCLRWGGKIPLQIALFLNGIISIAAPWLTAWGGWKVLCLCRGLQGLSQAGFYPSIHTLLAHWAPVSERGRLSSFVYTGSGFGTIVAFQLGGILADSRWGWPSIFWSSGLMCLVGFTLLTVFGASKPAEHKSISHEEKTYIFGRGESDIKKKAKTPWKKILTSRHVWACFCSHAGSGVSYVFFFTQFPTYMHAILRFDIKSSGLLSSLPYIMAFFSTILIGYLADFCTNRKIMSLKQTRIVCNSIGGVGAAVCMSAVSYVKDSSLAVGLFIMTLSLHTACHTGWMVNYIDLAPNYSGTLMAFGNTICNGMVVLLPVVVSSVVTDVTNPHQWQIIFLTIAGLLMASNVVYVCFMSTDVQSWNSIEQTKDSEEVKLEENQEKK